MSAAVDSGVYVKNDFSEPMSASHEFPTRFSPEEYAKIMHEHTKAQLGMATQSARRRSQGSATVPSLPQGSSSRSSVSSTGS